MLPLYCILWHKASYLYIRCGGRNWPNFFLQWKLWSETPHLSCFRFLISISVIRNVIHRSGRFLILLHQSFGVLNKQLPLTGECMDNLDILYQWFVDWGVVLYMILHSWRSVVWHFSSYFLRSVIYSISHESAAWVEYGLNNTPVRKKYEAKISYVTRLRVEYQMYIMIIQLKWGLCLIIEVKIMYNSIFLRKWK